MKHFLRIIAALLLGLFLFPVVYSVSLIYYQGGVYFILLHFLIFIFSYFVVYGIFWGLSKMCNNCKDDE